VTDPTVHPLVAGGDATGPVVVGGAAVGAGGDEAVDPPTSPDALGSCVFAPVADGGGGGAGCVADAVPPL
jgi:hypothetical protein